MRTLLFSLLAFITLPLVAAHADGSALLLEPPARVWGEILPGTQSAAVEGLRLELADGGTTVKRDGRLVERDGRRFFVCPMPAHCAAPARKGGVAGRALTLVLIAKGGTETRIALPPGAGWHNDRLVRVDVKDGSALLPDPLVVHGEVELVLDPATGEFEKAVLRALLDPPASSPAVRATWMVRGPRGFVAEGTGDHGAPQDLVHLEEEFVPDAGKGPELTGRWLLEACSLSGKNGSPTGDLGHRSFRPMQVQRRFVHFMGFPANAGRTTPAVPEVLQPQAELDVTPMVRASAFAPQGARFSEIYRLEGRADFGGADETATTRIGLLKDLGQSIEGSWVLRIAGFASTGVGAGLLDGSTLVLTVEHDDPSGAGRKTSTFALPLERSRRSALAGGVWWAARCFLDLPGGLEGGDLEGVELELGGKALAGDYVFTVEELTLAEPVLPTLDY